MPVLTSLQRPFPHDIVRDTGRVALEDLGKGADVVENVVAGHVLIRRKGKVVVRIDKQPVWRGSCSRIEWVVTLPIGWSLNSPISDDIQDSTKMPTQNASSAKIL